MTVTAIYAYETKAPENRDRIDWQLLTDLPFDDLKAAVCQAERYIALSIFTLIMPAHLTQSSAQSSRVWRMDINDLNTLHATFHRHHSLNTFARVGQTYFQYTRRPPLNLNVR